MCLCVLLGENQGDDTHNTVSPPPLPQLKSEELVQYFVNCLAEKHKLEEGEEEEEEKEEEEKENHAESVEDTQQSAGMARIFNSNEEQCTSC